MFLTSCQAGKFHLVCFCFKIWNVFGNDEKFWSFAQKNNTTRMVYDHPVASVKKGWWASALHRLSALSGFTDILKQQWDDSPTSNKCMFSTKSVSSLWMVSSCMLYLCTIIIAVASLSSARVDSWAVMPLSATCPYMLYIFVLTF